MTRAEHLQWAKQRALEYVDRGDLPQAFASLTSDLSKHDELENHMMIPIGFQMLMGGQLRRADEMRRFIEGFN